MQIGFDARAAFIDPHRGFGRVARSLAAALLRAFPGEVTLFVPHGVSVPPPWYPLAARIVRLRRPRRGAFLCDGPAWRWTLRRFPLDVLHLPTWTVPRNLPVAVVATFYDATPFYFRSPPQAWGRWRARRAILSLRRATRIHAISSHAQRQLFDTVPLPGDRVRVVFLGVDEAFAPPAEPEPARHLLFVGGGEVHKNLTVVFDALALPAGMGLPPLVIAGAAAADPGLSEQIEAHRLAARVRLVDSPSDAELVSLYRQALATVVPSRNEGFGLPALEAMACGCPVVAARAGALPEVCGDAAALLKPDDPAAWAAELNGLQENPERRRHLARAGLARAAVFTWERTAKEMLTVYREAARAFNSPS